MIFDDNLEFQKSKYINTQVGNLNIYKNKYSNKSLLTFSSLLLKYDFNNVYLINYNNNFFDIVFNLLKQNKIISICDILLTNAELQKLKNINSSNLNFYNFDFYKKNYKKLFGNFDLILDFNTLFYVPELLYNNLEYYNVKYYVGIINRSCFDKLLKNTNLKCITNNFLKQIEGLEDFKDIEIFQCLTYNPHNTIKSLNIDLHGRSS